MLYLLYVQVSNNIEGKKKTWKREERIRKEIANSKDGSGRIGQGGGKEREIWEGQREAVTQNEDRCGMSEKRKWKAKDKEMREERKKEEDRGKGKRLGQASGSEDSELCQVNALVDSIIPLNFQVITIVITTVYGNVI